MSKTAAGEGSASDASTEVVEVDATAEAQAKEQSLAHKVQVADGKAAVDAAKASLVKAKEQVKAAEEAVAQAKAELAELEEAV